MEWGQNGIDRCKDGATVAVGHDGLSDGRDDADGGLDPDLLESLIEWSQPKEIDDLGSFHGFSGGDVETGPISSNIGVPDDGEQPGSHDMAFWADVTGRNLDLKVGS